MRPFTPPTLTDDDDDDGLSDRSWKFLANELLLLGLLEKPFIRPFKLFPWLELVRLLLFEELLALAPRDKLELVCDNELKLKLPKPKLLLFVMGCCCCKLDDEFNRLEVEFEASEEELPAGC